MKLPTKLLFAFMAVFSVVFLTTFLVAIPLGRSYLLGREVEAARTSLDLAARQVRAWLEDLEVQRATLIASGLPPDEVDQRIAQREVEVYRRLEMLYAGFSFHDSGRIFLINLDGRYVMRPRANGETADDLAQTYAFAEDERDRLMTEIAGNRALNQTYIYPTTDLNGDTIEKRLFVTPMPRTSFYLCLTVNDDDLGYTSNLIGNVMTLILIITMLLLVVAFSWFYRRLSARYRRVVDAASRILQGQYDLQIADRSDDEIGILAQTIDQLAVNLQEKEELERQVRQMQRLELVGSMASGVTHEFNNILTGIRSALDLSLEILQDDPLDRAAVRETLEIGQSCAMRGHETVERLATFSRDNTANRQVVDIARLARDVTELCRHSFDKRIKLNYTPPSSRQVVEVDRNLIEQVLLNLLVNARDAIQADGGSIDIVVERHSVDSLKPPSDLKIQPWYATVTIRDDGYGMTPDTLSRIFDPYFSTKELGTGLGLSVVYKILREHDGWITADSEHNVGSEFIIHLPIARVDLSASQLIRMDKTARHTDSGLHVLIAHADPSQVADLTAGLQGAGHVVRGASSYAELCQAVVQDDTVAVILVDPNLPDLQDAEAIADLRISIPGCRFLVLAASKRDPRMAEFLAYGCDGMISQPFTLPELEDALKNSLDLSR